MDGVHFGDGPDSFHQENQNQLEEGNVDSWLVLRMEVFQKGEDLNFPQVMKEEIE